MLKNKLPFVHFRKNQTEKSCEYNKPYKTIGINTGMSSSCSSSDPVTTLLVSFTDPVVGLGWRVCSDHFSRSNYQEKGCYRWAWEVCSLHYKLTEARRCPSVIHFSGYGGGTSLICCSPPQILDTYELAKEQKVADLWAWIEWMNELLIVVEKRNEHISLSVCWFDQLSLRMIND